MRYSDKITIALLQYGLIFILMIIFSFFNDAKAQGRKWEVSKFLYTGMEASFGAKAATLESTLPELNGMLLIEEGGNAGFVFGNSFSRVVVRPLGFYLAASNSGRTINLYSAEVENNTYLLKGLLKKPVRFDVYSLLGLSFSSYKFFGHYVSKELRPEYNNKSGNEPYLGKVENIMLSAGLGLEYSLVNNNDFVHLFLAGKYQMPFQTTTDSQAFKKTGFSNSIDISIGLRFGLVAFNRNIHNKL